MRGIFSEGKFYGFDILKDRKPDDNTALKFCHEWFNNKQKFEIRTSGSTGIPKTIVLQRKNMEASARATGEYLHSSLADHLLLCLSIEAVGGLMMLVRAMEWNCNLTIVEPSADPMYSLLEDHNLTIVSLVPMQIYKILEKESSREKLGRFQHVIIGGAAIKDETVSELNKFKTVFYHSYGMTETCSHIALKQLNGIERQDHFQPLQGTELKLNDKGCLCIRSEVTSGEWLYTNDLAEIFPDGSFEITGRADQMINSGGVKIDPLKLEQTAAAILREMGEHDACFAVGLPDEKLGEKVVLFIEGIESSQVAEKLLQAMNTRLSRYEVPKAVIFAPSFILTASGKLDKRKTASLYSNG